MVPLAINTLFTSWDWITLPSGLPSLARSRYRSVGLCASRPWMEMTPVPASMLKVVQVRFDGCCWKLQSCLPVLACSAYRRLKAMCVTWLTTDDWI